MLIPQNGKSVYVIVGTPVFTVEDDETLGWVEAIMIAVEDKIDKFESSFSPFKLEQTGLGCVVSYCFDNGETANGVAKQLNEIVGHELYFFTIELDTGKDGGDNERKVRKIYFSISVMNSAPYSGETYMFITDAEYSEYASECKIEMTESESVCTAYSAFPEVATQTIWGRIEAEDGND